jgi:hypothetical protein
LTGTFWERSPAGSSYWAEMLGLCALHFFARAFSEFHQIQEWRATLCCNNKRALKLSSYDPPQDEAQRKICRHSAEPQGNKTQIYRKIYVPACVRPYGQTPTVAPIVPTPAVKLHVRYTSQTCNDFGNDGVFLH